MFLRPALGAVSFVATFFFCSMPAMSAQQPAAANNMNGIWTNVDANTRGLVRIQINGNKIHPYGACHPDLCDWGVLKAKSFAASVDSDAPAALLAKHDTGLIRSEITISLEAYGRLRVEVFTHFSDNSGRADYRTVNFFARNAAAYMP
jgi:hypothetical protein